MRKPSTLDALFTAPRQGILAATLMDPERWWYLSDLARHLGLHHATLQRELARLSRAELLLTKRDGNRSYYRANPDSPVFPDLRALLTKTAGLLDALRDVLRPFANQIESAFIYGSIARATESSQSDVDLIVIGKITLKVQASGIRAAEKLLSRPANPNLYLVSEFARKVAAENPFLLEVLDKEKLFVVGTQQDLDRLAQGRAGRGTQARTRSGRRSATGS